MSLVRPADEAELAQAVAEAAAASQGLEIRAGGSKRGLGRPARATHVLDVSAFSGVVDYDPAELVLTARAATPMQDLEALLARHGQMLAWEPPDWQMLLAADEQGGASTPRAPSGPTLGGVIACNLSGPRRVRAGAARDHLLGFAAVNGLGESWRAGSKMVKNVTGYDLSKLQAGAYGTLSVLTELTVRALPRPEHGCTLLLHGLGDETGVRTLLAALNTQHEVSAAAHLPAAVASRSRISEARASGRAVTALRLEGPLRSVDYRAGALTALFGRTTRLVEADSERFWAEIGSVQPLLATGGGPVWRICATPTEAPGVLRQIAATLEGAEGFYDWGGGLLWLQLDAERAGPDCGAATVRRSAKRGGGHAMLVRAPAEARERVAVFEPAEAPLEALARRVKAGFDPHGVLNPGRLQQGM